MSEQILASSVMGAPRLWAPQLEPGQPPRCPVSARGGGLWAVGSGPEVTAQETEAMLS